MGCGASSPDPGMHPASSTSAPTEQPAEQPTEQRHDTNTNKPIQQREVSVTATDDAAPPPQPLSQNQAPTNTVTTNAQVTNQASTDSTERKVILSFHSSYGVIANRVKAALEGGGVMVYQVTESQPSSLAQREQAVQWAMGLVILASAKYQRAQPLHELVNFTQTKSKSIFTIVVQPNYKPSGALGAIAAFGQIFTMDEEYLLLDAIKDAKADSKSIQLAQPSSTSTQSAGVVRNDGQGVVITHCSDAQANANFIISGLQSAGVNCSRNPGDIKACKVYIAIMSPEFEATGQEQYESARALGKQIVPVNYKKGYRPSGWLELGIAGKLYHRLYDQAMAYEKKYDSYPFNEFVFAVNSLGTQTTAEELETSKIKALESEVGKIKQEIVSKGGSWPPQAQASSTDDDEPPIENLKDLMQWDNSELKMAYIHHEITRMSFNPPQQLFDASGVPIKRRFDVMISYQWDIQPFVRDLYMDFDMRGMKTWFDIWGGMLGNIYDAMANAVESSTCIVSFLTTKYMKSINCNIEIKYAIACRKPIVFIKQERNVEIPPWLQEVVDRSPLFELHSVSDFGTMDGNIPRITRVTETIRKVIQKYIKYEQRDIDTEEVQTLRDMLRNGKIALSVMTTGVATDGSKECTRCGVTFTDTEPEGCKKHRNYYMGGTIIAGRWTCCQQTVKDSLGCEPCKHTTDKRQFREMQGFGGCFQWVPA